MAGQGSGGNVIAALASLFIPGLGQLLQGRLLMAIFMFVFAALLWFILLGWIIHLWSFWMRPGLNRDGNHNSCSFHHGLNLTKFRVPLPGIPRTNLRFCFVILRESMRRLWMDGHRTPGGAQGCVITRLQRFGLGWEANSPLILQAGGLLSR